MNYAIQNNDDELLKKALNILDWSLEIGWDEQYGGIYGSLAKVKRSSYS